MGVCVVKSNAKFIIVYSKDYNNIREQEDAAVITTIIV
jgi:hypothetical protein